MGSNGCVGIGARVHADVKKVVGFATHNQDTAYGCSVPRLTRFTVLTCMGPDQKCYFVCSPFKR
jgi:hypothetical protein